MEAKPASSKNEFDSGHEDVIHSAAFNFHGTLLATSSSDKSVRIFKTTGPNGAPNYVLQDVLKDHSGPVWNVQFSHPKYNLLATCGYDKQIIIYKYVDHWQKVYLYTGQKSMNQVEFADVEFGLILGGACSDGSVVLIYYDEVTKQWSTDSFEAHHLGCTSISFVPFIKPNALLKPSNDDPSELRIVTGGCDNKIILWTRQVKEGQAKWIPKPIGSCGDWVRDVSCAPSIGLPGHYLAVCSQDKNVYIYSTQDYQEFKIQKLPLNDVVWRVNWSLVGQILAASCGDNKVLATNIGIHVPTASKRRMVRGQSSN
eukprot:NODE_570_length_6597_cov_0.382271.p2 type:complete len:313 gc:universal NODE_570_length_6597_cov_0.382271:4456-5394(+)